MATRQYTVTPSAARLATSLRDIGYDFSTAVADVVDNSIAAGAANVDISFNADPPRVVISDDGSGMTRNNLNEALRFGSRRDYSVGDLGRYGLGLKTASLSQCRSLTVVTRDSRLGTPHARQLDLDIIDKWDEWLIVDPGRTPAVEEALGRLADSAGTIVVWEKLDRAFAGRYKEGAWAVRRVEMLKAKAKEHLELVFQRFIDGSAGRRVAITIDQVPIEPWDPFATGESETLELDPLTFDIQEDNQSGTVGLRRWILPARSSFGSAAEFERMGGPLKWNRQQGIYIYRANRLVQWGGWAGIRAIDEHTKLARCSLDFSTDLDSVFGINVAKMRVSVPVSLKRRLEKPLHEICQVANERYRRNSPGRGGRASSPAREATTDESAALALLAAAVKGGHYDSLAQIAHVLKDEAPGVARRLGLDRL
ncbi:ATP-binding protein [Enemella sp. A6]|uniref:ATP-binding protein n=1 Tax=Enemella sp. A6 TaxID=3440152 RepID=UPI003EB92EB4